MTSQPPIAELLTLARDAGQLLVDMQPGIVRDTHRRTVKPDGSLVTDADVKALELITRRLRALAPDLPIIAEEQTSDVNKTILESGSAFWLVDSLDNTCDYVLGGRNYSVNIAQVNEKGESVRGVIVFPGLDETYYTNDEGGACLQKGDGEPCRIQVIDFGDAAVEAAPLKVALHPSRKTQVDSFQGRPLYFVTTRGQRRACLVATGEVALCIESEGYYIWDTAPVSALLTAAGGGVYNLEDAQRLLFNRSLRLPAYAAAASRQIPEQMGLFSPGGAHHYPPLNHYIDEARKRSGA